MGFATQINEERSQTVKKHERHTNCLAKGKLFWPDALVHCYLPLPGATQAAMAAMARQLASILHAAFWVQQNSPSPTLQGHSALGGAGGVETRPPHIGGECSFG